MKGNIKIEQKVCRPRRHRKKKIGQIPSSVVLSGQTQVSDHGHDRHATPQINRISFGIVSSSA